MGLSRGANVIAVDGCRGRIATMYSDCRSVDAAAVFDLVIREREVWIEPLVVVCHRGLLSLGVEPTRVLDLDLVERELSRLLGTRLRLYVCTVDVRDIVIDAIGRFVVMVSRTMEDHEIEMVLPIVGDALAEPRPEALINVLGLEMRSVEVKTIMGRVLTLAIPIRCLARAVLSADRSFTTIANAYAIYVMLSLAHWLMYKDVSEYATQTMFIVRTLDDELRTELLIGDRKAIARGFSEVRYLTPYRTLDDMRYEGRDHREYVDVWRYDVQEVEIRADLPRKPLGPRSCVYILPDEGLEFSSDTVNLAYLASMGCVL